MIWKRPMRTIDFVIWVPICAAGVFVVPGLISALIASVTP